MSRRLVPLLVAAAVLGVVLVVWGVVRLADPPGEGEGCGPDEWCGAAPGSGSSGQGGMDPPATASDLPASAPPAADQPMSRFTEVTATAGGRALRVTFSGGVEDCYDHVLVAKEAADQVALSVTEDRTGDGPCIDLAQEYTMVAQLREPLGTRPVVDADTGAVVLAPRT